MNLLQNILNILNLDNLEKVFNITNTLSNFQPKDDVKTQNTYYQLPTYNYEAQNSNNNLTTQQPQAQNNGIDIQTIIKIVGTIMQLFNNKKQKEDNTAPEAKENKSEESPSKIQQLTRI